MITKKEIKYLSSLKQKKNRYLNHEILIEGTKLILDAFKHKQNIKKIIYSNKNNQFNEIRKYAKKNNVIMELCSNKDAERISDTKNSQQIFALLKYQPLIKLNINKNILNNKIIILDGVSDPGNMGTILRTCSWFGIYDVILSNNSVEFYNPKTVRSGMGAHFHMQNIYQDKIENVITYLKKYKYEVLAANLNGINIKEYKLRDKNWALIVGNEANGLSEISSKNAQLIHIEGEKTMESLNVAEATSIVIHYLYKK